MTDIFPVKIPLPVPRPSIDDIPVDPRIFIDKPIEKLYDIWSTPSLSILERIKMGFSSYSGYGAEALAVAERNPWTTVAWLFVGSLVVVAVMRLVWYVMGWKW